MSNTETLRALVDAGNRLDSAMDMQEQRERGTFHLSQQAAAGVWKDARRLWAEAVEQALSAPAAEIDEAMERFADEINGIAGEQYETNRRARAARLVAYLTAALGREGGNG